MSKRVVVSRRLLISFYSIWGGLFSASECSVRSIRQKEDSWNSIISGFLTGGILAARCECTLGSREDG